MEMFMLKIDVKEDSEVTMARFLNELNRDIADKVELQYYMDLDEMYQIASKMESQLKRKGKRGYGGSSFTPWKGNWKKEDKESQKGKSTQAMSRP